jgi:HSP20 family molecular chaperone IbpA
VAHERPDGLQEPAEVVTATLKNGILNLELPKAGKVRTDRVER